MKKTTRSIHLGGCKDLEMSVALQLPSRNVVRLPRHAVSPQIRVHLHVGLKHVLLFSGNSRILLQFGTRCHVVLNLVPPLKQLPTAHLQQ